MGAEAWLAGVDLEPSIMEVGKHIFKDSNIFFPRAFCDMQKVIYLDTYSV